MSIGAEGKYLFCDGKDCQARTLAPVALHRLLPEGSEAPLSTQGWLFVLENARTCHYCPRCAPHYLNALSRSECKPDDSD